MRTVSRKPQLARSRLAVDDFVFLLDLRKLNLHSVAIELLNGHACVFRAIELKPPGQKQEDFLASRLLCLEPCGWVRVGCLEQDGKLRMSSKRSVERNARFRLFDSSIWMTVSRDWRSRD
jgi:hypothetical protein